MIYVYCAYWFCTYEQINTVYIFKKNNFFFYIIKCITKCKYITCKYFPNMYLYVSV